MRRKRAFLQLAVTEGSHLFRYGTFRTSLTTIAFTIACGTLALGAGTYDRWGVSNEDVAAYTKAASAIQACTAARLADRNPMNPAAYPQNLMRVASLYGQCGDSLKKQHASDAVLRTNDLFLSFTCSVLGSATGVAVNAPACAARSDRSEKS